MPFRYVLGLAAPILVIIGANVGTVPAQSAPKAATWAAVAPILSKNCASCHSGDSPAGGLGLESFARLQKGGASGKAIVPGASKSSLLVKRIHGTIQPRMPLGGALLSQAELAAIEGWIDAGASVGANPGPVKPPAAPSLPKPGQPVLWKDVAPIFGRRCVQCHTANGQMGGPPEGYRLDSYANAISNREDGDDHGGRRDDDRGRGRGRHGGRDRDDDRRDRGRNRGRHIRIVPGDPSASKLVRMIRGLEEHRMPPIGPALTSAEIRVISDWIRQGAKDDNGRRAPNPGLQ